MLGLTIKRTSKATATTPVVSVGQWAVMAGGCVAHWHTNGAPACDVLDRLKARVLRSEWRADPKAQRCPDCIHRIRYPQPAKP